MRTGRITSPLKAEGRSSTLAGGTEGSNQAPKERPSSASSAGASGVASDATLCRTAMDALSAMCAGFLGRDRELLDRGFEDLVTAIEEMRDAVPKV